MSLLIWHLQIRKKKLRTRSVLGVQQNANKIFRTGNTSHWRRQWVLPSAGARFPFSKYLIVFFACVKTEKWRGFGGKARVLRRVNPDYRATPNLQKLNTYVSSI